MHHFPTGRRLKNVSRDEKHLNEILAEYQQVLLASISHCARRLKTLCDWAMQLGYAVGLCWRRHCGIAKIMAFFHSPTAKISEKCIAQLQVLLVNFPLIAALFQRGVMFIKYL